MKVALCTIAFRERLLEYSLDLACEAGIDGVEIWGREPHISEEYESNRVAATKKMVQERGLEVAVFGSYLRFGTVNTESMRLRDVLQTAAGLGVPIVRVWASDVGSAQADDEVWRETVLECREAACAAEKMGMRLAAEMHTNTLADTARSARRLVEDINCDNFGLNFQPLPELDNDAEERLQHVLPFVFHMHAQNYAPLDGSPEKLERAGLAEGVIDYAPLVEQLQNHEYEGYVAVEFSPSNADDKYDAVVRDCRYLRAIKG
jgi:sugar phosphate isomerase/epimerase